MAKPCDAALVKKLEELGLEQYSGKLSENGYDQLKDIVEMSAEERGEVAEDCGMLKGHARKVALNHY